MMHISKLGHLWVINLSWCLQLSSYVIASLSHTLSSEKSIKNVLINYLSNESYSPQISTSQRLTYLSRTSPTNNTYSLASFKCTWDSFQNKRSSRSVSDLYRSPIPQEINPLVLWPVYFITVWLLNQLQSNVIWSFYRYLGMHTCKFCSSTLPWTGQFGDGRRPSIMAGLSLLILMYCWTRSREMILFDNWQIYWI